MKKLLLLFCFVAGFYIVKAQAPQGFSYQAAVRNAVGLPYSNKSIKVQFSILDSTSNGPVVYKETHSATTNSGGMFNLNVGMGTAITGTLAGVNWGNNAKFLQVDIDTTPAGSNYVNIGVQQLMSVPYALYSQTSGSTNNLTYGVNFTHYIGEQFGGGIIFHLWKDALGVEHGLILDKTDLSSSQPWSNITSVSIGVNAQSSWDGLSNSSAIVGQSGHTSSAAKICLDLIKEGQSDWYLPSIQELFILWSNYYTVASSIKLIPGATQLQTVRYYSSTESKLFSTNQAWTFNFNAGEIYSTLKSNANYVRAIRAF